MERLKSNLFAWYNFKKNANVVIFSNDEYFGKSLSSIVNIIDNIENADYIIFIENSEKLDILNNANFKNDVRIIVVDNNQLSVNNLSKYPDIQKCKDNDKLNIDKYCEILNKFGFPNFETFYMFPNYNCLEMLFKSSYQITKEQLANYITVSDKESVEFFDEKELLVSALENNDKLLKYLSNSYFIEFSKTQINNDINYVAFNNPRKEEYSLITILRNDVAEKVALSEPAKKHLMAMEENNNELKKLGINVLDYVEGDKYYSKLIKNYKTISELMIENSSNIDYVVEKFKKIRSLFEKSTIKFNEEIEKTLNEYDIDINTIKDLPYLKNAYIDFIPRNCFEIDEEIWCFDQEWKTENLPLDYVIYRGIANTPELLKYININELYEKLGIFAYIETFEKIDAKILESTIDEELYGQILKQRGQQIDIILEDIKKKENHIQNLEKEKDMTSEHIKNLEKEKELTLKHIENLEQERQMTVEHIKNLENEKELTAAHIKNLETENTNLQENFDDLQAQKDDLEVNVIAYRNGVNELTNLINQKDEQLVNYANQLRSISNSISWKITKPIRILSWALNPKSGASLLDRILPPGSSKRIEYDKKQTQKKYEKRVANYFKLTDEETAEYWKGIDHRLHLKQEKLLEKKNKNELTDYEKWMEANEPNEQELEIQTKVKFKKRPKISIVVPLYNTDTDFFRELLYGLHCQTYQNWELCLADGSPEELTEIKKMCEKDKRIKYKYLNENRGISENTNAAIELCTGDYISLLDHDDLLSLDALYEVVKCINENPDVEFIYSDEDKFHTIDESRYEPHFKPDFAPDTLRANNYICHYSVFKKELLNKIGGFNSEFDGSQDYDIILRATEKAKKIVHISKVLYYWRVHKASTAMSMEAKPYTIDAGKRAIEAHLKRIGLQGNVKNGCYPGTYEIIYNIKGNPKVSILIPNKDGIDILQTCLKSILDKTIYDNYEIIIIENNSENQETFEYYKKLEENPKIKVLYYKEKGFNYSKLINFGVKNCTGDFVVQLNNDTELLTPEWLNKMIGFAQREDVGAVGVKLYYPDYTIQHAGIMVGVLQVAAHIFRGLYKDHHGYFGRQSLLQNMNAVTAACIMTKKEIYEQIGFMNEEFAVAFNDVDFCLRIRKAGKLIVYNPFVEFKHYESKSRGNDNDPDKIERFKNEINLFLETWKDKLIQGDEYYNKNFRLDSDQYAIRTEKIEK